MGLNEKWVDKVDGVDYVLAKDINNIANAVIDLERTVGGFDNFSNALIGHASGKAIRAEGVSPIKHTIKTKVASKNLFGFNGRTVLDFGGNANDSIRHFRGNGIYIGVSASNYYYSYVASYEYDETNEQITVTTSMANFGVGIDIKVTPNTTYFVSGDIPGDCFVSVAQYDASGNYISFKHCRNSAFTTERNADWVLVVLLCQTNTTRTFANVQIELGKTATEYRPYVDASAVTVTGIGKNFFDISKVKSDTTHNNVINNGDGTLTINTGSGSSAVQDGQSKLKHLAPNLIVGETYTLSANSTGTDKKVYLLNSVSAYNLTWNFGASVVVTEDMLNSYVYYYASGNATTATISDVQIELGDKATEFEPYIEPVPYAVVDGVAEVKPVYPTTTIFSNTKGAILEATYNKDINKAIAELVNAIITLGGNI